MKRLHSALTVAVFAVALAPGFAHAQSANTASIAGSARDATGAVLPGVTVEASSPALIEKTRTVVTDDRGEYKIVELRPGSYTVTFSLAGFGAVRREGLELTTGFTATVNAEMKVGSLQETVTVSGASPVVDVQNVRTQSVLSRESLDAIPNAHSLVSFAAITLGATLSNAAQQDVGGSQGETSGNGGWIVHNNRASDGRNLLDGMPYYMLVGENSPGNATTYVNQFMVQEMTMTTSGASAESETGGVMTNFVPKDGGNRFTGTFAANGSGERLISSNLTSDLRARQLTTAPTTKKVYDIGGGIGGPIMQERLWFYHADRFWNTEFTVPGVFYNATPHSMVYTPIPDRPLIRTTPHQSYDVRVTWQASRRHKITAFEQIPYIYRTGFALGNIATPEASADNHYHPQYLTQATWSFPATSRLLFEAGNTTLLEKLNIVHSAGTLPTDIPITELNTSIQYNARATDITGNTNYGRGGYQNTSNQRWSMSYVTGSHAFKSGLFLQEGWAKVHQEVNYIPGLGPVSYSFRNGLPSSITEWTWPMEFKANLMPNLGLFAQDQWTLKRFTLNLGVRYDYVRQYSPAGDLAAIPAFAIPVRHFDKVDNIPNLKDVDPRLGVAYDVFGNGKTAVKASFGRYVQSQVSSLGYANAPQIRTAISVTRTWNDVTFAAGDPRRSNFVPDCNLADPGVNGECGQISNRLFGQPIPSTTYAKNILNGSGIRPYDWQGSVALQHELRPNMALSVGYFNIWYGNFSVTSNTAVTPSDFTQYCVTAPVDARLGAVSGTQVCGFYDVNPSRFGQTSNLVELASAFGTQYEHFNGIDVALNFRFGRGGLVQGGVSTGQTIRDNCELVQGRPQIALASGGAAAPRATKDFCHVVTPWASQTQLKFQANYPLPWYGIQMSGTFQDLPGIPISASNVFTNAQIVPSLVRNLSAGAAATATLQLIVPNTMFEERLYQTDLRFTKALRVGGFGKLNLNFDMYNAFNASTILAINTTYGPKWLQPTSILGGRMLKFGGQFNF